MKEKFLKSLITISLLTLVLSTIASVFVYNTVYMKRAREDMSDLLYALSLSVENHDDTRVLKEISANRLDLRISLIDSNGKVLFDSYGNEKTLDLHGDRPEILQAQQVGMGEDRRYSDTLSTEMIYLAKLLDNDQVLRISREMDSLLGAFLKVLPLDLLVTVIIFVISIIVSSKFTQRTFAPLNNLDTDVLNIDINEFKELSPFIQKIKEQNLTIQANVQELQQEKETIQTILKNMNEGLMIIDKDQHLLSVNDRAYDIFNKTRDLTGENILNLVRDTQLIEAIETALIGQGTNFVLPIDDRAYTTYVNPVLESGQVRGAVVLLIDETEKLRAEKLREEFSSNVSHELKTPLTSISGFSELLTQNMVAENDREEIYQLIYMEAQRLLIMVEDIMKISGFDEVSGYTREAIDLNELMADILQTKAKRIDKRELKVTLTGRAQIFENKTMMWELFGNLISNAVKYNQDHGILAIDIEEMQDTVSVKITDTGIGIPEEDLDRIFERFYRVDKSRSKKVEGTGLGLSIVKHIIQKVGGTIQIDSAAGQGTSFTVILPVDELWADSYSFDVSN